MQLDDNMELDPSTDSALDVSADADLETGSESSPEQASETEKDTLSIVRDVVDAAKTGSEPGSQPEGQEEDQQPGGQEPKKGEENEDYSDVPFSKHPRFKQLLRERNTFKADADRYQNVQKFMDEHGIDAEEAAEGFVIMGLMRTNPVEAWNKLKPYVQNLLVASGEVLPDDLANAVRNGEITHERAVELSRTQARLQATEQQQSFQQQRSQQTAQQQAEQALYDTAINWEQDRRAKDPNFQAKLVPIYKELAYIQMTEGKPKTPQGVLDQLKRAYESVTVPVQTAQPVARPRTVPRASMSGQVSGNAQPKPQTTLDIIRAARSKR